MAAILFGITGSELLMITGIALIILAAAAGITSLAVFARTGKKLKEKLKQEYGDNG